LEALADLGFSGLGDSLPHPRKRNESISKGTKIYLFFIQFFLNNFFHRKFYSKGLNVKLTQISKMHIFRK
jgi:hypothetical protein